ncbi:beta-aspartyl-peptidase [Alteromonas sp. H39]|uniref:beta-aspartyl-peptidase n=1 Tax=Alteromonas sp. H39 TaxID=3389876 RepID=UPI0039DF79DC
MITLIKGADVYAPTPMGINDILIAHDKIVQISPSISIQGDAVSVMDGTGCIAMPGLVDSLVHITGGGGEGGFHTRTPQMQLTEATTAGVTTVVGALGTDATTRTLPDLIAKARALCEEGISAYCYTGSYQLPARTITGSITDDIILIDNMIGIGEVAIADHRGSQPTTQELAKVAADARVGGMLSGKGGIVSIHTGDASDQLTLLHDVINTTSIPASQFYPTHINRSQSLLEAGQRWCEAGGIIDMTTSTNKQFIEEGEIPAAQAIAWCLQQGINASQLTMSSDGNASLPVFDADGELIGLEVGKVRSLFDAWQTLARTEDVLLQDAIAVVTSSPASVLKLKNKGKLAAGCDADIVLCDAKSLNIQDVLARGKRMVSNKEALIKGTFEA